MPYVFSMEDHFPVMRLWSLHPRYLDRVGLVALWREALLAQAVLRGKTRGYRYHPQLARFRNHPDPEGMIAAYLEEVYREASRRGYLFDATKIGRRCTKRLIPVACGQIRYEWELLLKKLFLRDPDAHRSLKEIIAPEPHPILKPIAGDVEAWEKFPADEKRRTNRPAKSRF
jgi:hypothetical protein